MKHDSVPGDVFFATLAIVLGGIGIVQLLYLVPSYFYLRKTGRTGVAKGLVVGASITFLLNSACWGWFLIAKPRIGG